MAAVLVVPILLILAPLYVIVILAQGRPFLYTSKRMRTCEEAFTLYKIRTMRPATECHAERVLGGDLNDRVTRIGAFLRRTRLDELPQIFNVLRGDIGFIGPRPPLQRHVDARPDLFARVLDRTLPGITGLATVVVHAREERILARCRSAEESEDVYLSRCVPVKLRLDLIYARRRGVWLDLMILWRTVARLNYGAMQPKRTSTVIALPQPADAVVRTPQFLSKAA